MQNNLQKSYRFFFLSLLLVLNSMAVFAQKGNGVTISTEKDSVLAKDSSYKFRRRFDFMTDIRSSFINDAPVTVYGATFGLWVSRKVRLGLGGYTLSQNSKKNIIGKRNINNINKPPANRITSSNLELYFATLNLRYRWLNSKKFEINTPFEIGFGQSSEDITFLNNKETEVTKTKTGSFVPVQLGVGVIYKMTRWAGLQTSIGYRFSVLESDFKSNFDGIYYNYGVIVYLGKIISDLKKKSITKKFTK